MTEPAASAETAPAALTPEQATAEIAQIRGNADHDWHHQGRPGFDAAQERVMQLYQRAHSSTEPSGEPGALPAGRIEVASPGEPPPRPNVFEDPHADPTAAILDAVPLPEGLDPVKNQAINRVAEREGLTRFVLEGRRVLAGTRSGPPVDPVATERVLRARWGSAFPSKLEAAHLGIDAVLAELPPEERAEWERGDADIRDDVLEFMARVGEALMDPTTPQGEARLKEKYRQWVERQPR